MIICPNCTNTDPSMLEVTGALAWCAVCSKTFRAVSEVISALGTPFTPNGDGLVGGSDGSKIGKKDSTMKLICALLVLLLLPSLAHAQETPFADALSAITADSFAQDTAKDHGTRAKVDMALIIGSVTFSGVAAAYTVLCESAKICHEVNPVMQRLLGRGLPTVIVFKASVNAAAHYLVWRYAPEGKWRTIMLGVIGGINAADAINDGRVVRRALRERG